MQTLNIGSHIRAVSFNRAFPLHSAREYGDDVFNQCKARGESTAYAINSGVSIVSDRALAARLAQQDRENFTASMIVEDGATYLIEGVPHRCKVHGERFSDAIVFFPV